MKKIIIALTIIIAITSEAFAVAYKKSIIEKLDKNQDGVVSFKEFNNASKRMFNKLDKNHDNLLSIKELKHKIAKKFNRSANNHTWSYDFDMTSEAKSKFMKLNQDDLIAKIKLKYSKRIRMFEKMDIDGNNNISKIEFLRGYKKKYNNRSKAHKRNKYNKNKCEY